MLSPSNHSTVCYLLPIIQLYAISFQSFNCMLSLLRQDIFDLFTGDNTPYTYDSVVIAKTQRRTPSILNPFSTESAETCSLSETLSGLIVSKNSSYDLSTHADEFNRILKDSSYYSPSNSNIKCQSGLTVVEGMPASACNHATAIGNLMRGVHSERSRVYSIASDSNISYITGAVSLIAVLAIMRYLLNMLMYVPYKAKSQKKGADKGINLIVAITKEMRQLNMEHNIVSPSPSPKENIVACSVDDSAVLGSMNEICDHTISSGDNMNDIVIPSSSANSNNVASNRNSSSNYNDHRGLRCRTPLSSGEDAVINERRKS